MTATTTTGRAPSWAGDCSDGRPRDLPERELDGSQVRALAAAISSTATTPRPSSRSRPTWIRARASSSVSTPTRTWSSPARSTTSTSRSNAVVARWPAPSRTRRLASWSCPSAPIGSTRRTSRGRLSTRSTRAADGTTATSARATAMTPSCWRKPARPGLIRPFLARLRARSRPAGTRRAGTR